MLENEYIKLRAIEPEDLDLLYAWENDPSVWHVGETLSPYSRYVLKEYIANSHRSIYEQKQLRLIIEQKTSGNGVGLIDLYDFDPHHGKAGVGILVREAHRGKGMASEALQLLARYAFSFLKIHQLYAYIPSSNEASKALLLRCGFTVAGTLADWISAPEGYADVLIVQRLNK
ncbi:N-acetyltransferase [Bacteroidia bacterium]|nr:N-acetyltransferase [Bacteroidia bacterium]